MTSTEQKTVMLLTEDDAIREAVREAIDPLADVILDVTEGTLSKINGKAVEMAEAHDVVVFNLDTSDATALADLRRNVGPRGILLALSSNDISLADARMLKRSGVDEILPFPLPVSELREQIEHFTAPRPQLPAVYSRDAQRRLGQVFAVIPVRGGIGASTLAANLAGRLLDPHGIIRKTASNSVALVDLDLQFGTTASALDLPPSDTFYRLASDGTTPDRTFIDQSMASHESGLKVITAPDEFMPMDAISRTQINGLIDGLRQDFDFSVLDVPRTLVDWIAPVIAKCDRLLLVTDTTVPSIRQAHRMIEFFKEERFEPPVEIVVSHEKKPVIPAGHHSEAQKILGRPLKYWLPFDPRNTRAALDRGQLLSRVSGGSPLTKAIKAMGRTILKETATQATATATK